MYSESLHRPLEKLPPKENKEQIKREGEHRVVEKAKEFIAQGKIEILGIGQSGKVFSFTDDNLDSRWVLKQETGRIGRQQELGLTFTDEFKVQDAAFGAIEQARIENKKKRFARIPRPYSLLHDEDGKEWLVMEALDGETLFERAAKNLLLTETDDQEERREIEAMKKEELLDGLMRSYSVAFEDEHFVRIANEARRYTKGLCSFLTREQFTALKNTVEELHRRGIYHRDLHASNVMLLKDGGIAIIDFGASVQIESGSAEAATMYTLKVQQIDDKTRAVTKLTSDDDHLRRFENFITPKKVA